MCSWKAPPLRIVHTKNVPDSKTSGCSPLSAARSPPVPSYLQTDALFCRRALWAPAQSPRQAPRSRPGQLKVPTLRPADPLFLSHQATGTHQQHRHRPDQGGAAARQSRSDARRVQAKGEARRRCRAAAERGNPTALSLGVHLARLGFQGRRPYPSFRYRSA